MLNHVKFVATKKGMTTHFFPLSFLAVFGSGIWDHVSGSGINLFRITDPGVKKHRIPDPQCWHLHPDFNKPQKRMKPSWEWNLRGGRWSSDEKSTTNIPGLRMLRRKNVRVCWACAKKCVLSVSATTQFIFNYQNIFRMLSVHLKICHVCSWVWAKYLLAPYHFQPAIFSSTVSQPSKT